MCLQDCDVTKATNGNLLVFPYNCTNKDLIQSKCTFMSVLVWVVWDDAKFDTVIASFSVCPIKIDHERLPSTMTQTKKGII